MYCGRCDTIPFWRWLKLNQKFAYSIACYDYDGEALSNLQANNFTNCFTASDYTFGILDLQLLITPLASSIFTS
jgi:hypothetical protein